MAHGLQPDRNRASKSPALPLAPALSNSSSFRQKYSDIPIAWSLELSGCQVDTRLSKKFLCCPKVPSLAADNQD